MSKLRVHSFSISIDGYGAGPDQDLENPLGVGGLKVFDWFFPTRTWQRMDGSEDGEIGIDDNVAAKGFEGIGAYILGRNMFGPVRGPWSEGPDEWKGWWGDEPPYHTPVFVLTHHPRAPLKMEGGTEFRFVTDGAHSVLKQAKRAAGGKDVRFIDRSRHQDPEIPIYRRRFGTVPGRASDAGPITGRHHTHHAGRAHAVFFSGGRGCSGHRGAFRGRCVRQVLPCAGTHAGCLRRLAGDTGSDRTYPGIYCGLA
jgi:dihydrofolate reductase